MFTSSENTEDDTENRTKDKRLIRAKKGAVYLSIQEIKLIN